MTFNSIYREGCTHCRKHAVISLALSGKSIMKHDFGRHPIVSRTTTPLYLIGDYYWETCWISFTGWIRHSQLQVQFSLLFSFATNTQAISPIRYTLCPAIVKRLRQSQSMQTAGVNGNDIGFIAMNLIHSHTRYRMPLHDLRSGKS